MPSASSQRARRGTGIPCRAVYKMTMLEAYTRPSIVAGSSRAVMPLSPCARTTAYACQYDTYAATPATASTAAAVDTRIVRSVPAAAARLCPAPVCAASASAVTVRPPPAGRRWPAGGRGDERAAGSVPGGARWLRQARSLPARVPRPRLRRGAGRGRAGGDEKKTCCSSVISREEPGRVTACWTVPGPTPGPGVVTGWRCGRGRGRRRWCRCTCRAWCGSWRARPCGTRRWRRASR